MQFRTALADICVAYTVGAFWTLAFESPIITIEKVVFRNNNSRERSEDKHNENKNNRV